MEEIVKNVHSKAVEARKNSYSPYSKFKVGAAFKLKGKDIIVSGCNVENASFGATVCAERGAIQTSIAQYGKQELELLVVVTDISDPVPPCALCLQVLAEFNSGDLSVFLADNEKIVKKYKLKDLLPYPFNSF